MHWFDQGLGEAAEAMLLGIPGVPELRASLGHDLATGAIDTQGALRQIERLVDRYLVDRNADGPPHRSDGGPQ